MNTCKDQFTEWSPAYPVVFRSWAAEVPKKWFSLQGCTKATMRTHNIAINAINKAMKK